MEEQNKAVAVMGDTMVPRNLNEIKELATFMAASDLIPKSLGGRKENVAMVLLLGHEIGAPGIAALSNIYVVNGRPSIWGDLATALVRRSPLCESLTAPTYTGEGSKLTVSVSGKRKGDPKEATFSYSMEDAKLAGLLGKDTWIKSPKDMLFWKAFHRLAKFLWPDVLKGISIREIAEDFIEVEAEKVVVETVKVEPVKPEPAKLPETAPEKKPGRPAGSKNKPKVEDAEIVEHPIGVEPAPANPAAETLEGIPAETPEEATQKPPAAPENTAERVFGTLLGCVKSPSGALGAKMSTKNGEEKFIIEKLEEAKELHKFAGKTVELTVEKLETPIGEAKFKMVSYSVVNP